MCTSISRWLSEPDRLNHQNAAVSLDESDDYKGRNDELVDYEQNIIRIQQIPVMTWYAEPRLRVYSLLFRYFVESALLGIAAPFHPPTPSEPRRFISQEELQEKKIPPYRLSSSEGALITNAEPRRSSCSVRDFSSPI